jgi:branched-subunit amino acid aminotransferase/4-amino-4-deoxychorismate lyase
MTASPDVLLGAGLYETVRVSDGVALHGERHLERMTASAHALGLPAPDRAAFAGAIRDATGEGDTVRVRLHAPGGEPELAAERRASRAPEPLRATVLGGWYAPGYLLREHKLTSHFHGFQGRRLARAAGYDDALLVAHDGRVGEATNANVTHLAGGVLVTPSVDGLLPGVCRAALLDAARELGLAMEARPVALAELVDADAVLLTSSPRGLSEVIELDGHALRRSAPELLAALRERVAAAARAHALALP